MNNTVQLIVLLRGRGSFISGIRPIARCRTHASMCMWWFAFDHSQNLRDCIQEQYCMVDSVVARSGQFYLGLDWLLVVVPAVAHMMVRIVDRIELSSHITMTIFQRSYFYTTLVFLLLLGTTVVTAQEQQQQCADEDNGGECLAAAAAEECKDLDDKCLQWASVGKCSDEELDLRTTCPKSCRTCWSCDNVDDSCAGKCWSYECYQ